MLHLAPHHHPYRLHGVKSVNAVVWKYLRAYSVAGVEKNTSVQTRQLSSPTDMPLLDDQPHNNLGTFPTTAKMSPPSASIDTQPITTGLVPTKAAPTSAQTHSSASRLTGPLTYSGSLDQYEQFDVTAVIGREFPTLQLSEILEDAIKLRDLAILGEYFINPIQSGVGDVDWNSHYESNSTLGENEVKHG